MRKLLYLLDAEAPRLPPAEGFVSVCLPPSAAAEERLREISDAEVIFGEPELSELRHGKKLRWVQMFWAGADRYLHGGFPENVLLTTASGAFGETISEHALGMLFSLCRRLPAYAKAQSWADLGCEKSIAGKTALIFGCGDIGSQLAVRLQALGVRTIGICRDVKKPRTGFDGLTTLRCAEAFFPQAEFLLCALPASPETERYFHAERLSLLREDAVLINVGRGSLIDTEALTARVSAGKLFGVGLDVTAPEPLPASHPLWSLPNVIITPHVAGVSFGHLRQTEEKIWALCQENLLRYSRGLPLKNRVELP